MSGPERIWAWTWNLPYSKHHGERTWQQTMKHGGKLGFSPWIVSEWPGLRFWKARKVYYYQEPVEYVRVDLAPQAALDLTPDPRVTALVDAAQYMVIQAEWRESNEGVFWEATDRMRTALAAMKGGDHG